MKFLTAAKAAAAKFNEGAVIEYELPPAEDAIVHEIPEGWVHLGERNGKPHYRTTPGIAVPKPSKNAVIELLKGLPRESARHSTGGTCPHCLGSGRYSAHRGHFKNEKCFRCNGKGVLNSKDLAYLRRREAADEPVCRVATA
jgi:hypothetical protein